MEFFYLTDLSLNLISLTSRTESLSADRKRQIYTIYKRTIHALYFASRAAPSL
jgi:hypothetical protein